MESNSYAQGEVVCELRNAPAALYVVLAGEVLCFSSAKGVEQGEVPTRLGEGATFGEGFVAQAGQPLHVVAAAANVRCARLTLADCEAMIGPIHQAADRHLCRTVLASMKHFASLTIDELSALVMAFTPRRVQADEVIVSQG